MRIDLYCSPSDGKEYKFQERHKQFQMVALTPHLMVY